MANPLVTQDAQVLLRGQEGTSEERLNEILSSYHGKKEELVPILQQVQQVFGYLPEPAMNDHYPKTRSRRIGPLSRTRRRARRAVSSWSIATGSTILGSSWPPGMTPLR